ncbi:MAG: pyruvate:ferredoxin (flavodoxin) oxidoreductase [Marinifilaceae bacterium]
MAVNKQIIDGCTAATHIAYAMSDIATIYPISPASDMGETADKWANAGRLNLMGQPMAIHEMQSEAGAAGAVHGCLSGGALTTTFTASQGLLLMIPNMYKIAGELLPAVFHVTARSLSAHALSIFGDHQDVMACRQTGFAFLASSTVQECMDLGLVAHLAAIEGSVPFCHFFDGWRTSSEMDTVSMINYEEIRPLVNWEKVAAFRSKAMNPEHPDIRGTAQNPDVYFQNREAANLHYTQLPQIVEESMKKVGQQTGRKYYLFDYVGHPQATSIIIIMGSGGNVVEEVVNHLVSQGEKVGLIKVRLFRPFSVHHFINALPVSVEKISVMDRTKEPGSQGEPLFLDICTAVHTQGKRLQVYGGRYGLSSKDLTPAMVNAVFQNMKSSNPKTTFTVGITDDVSNLSLSVETFTSTVPDGTVECKFYGLGSDGTVGANKQAAYIIGNNTNKHAQAYFAYDSKKSEGYTVSHLRFGDSPIQSSYQILQADYIACHKNTFVNRFNVIESIKKNGIFVLNSPWTLEEMEHELPATLRASIAKSNVRFFNIDAVKIATSVGLGGRINMIMQTVFFKLTNVMNFEKAITQLKENVKQIYAKKGSDVVQMNLKAIDDTIEELVEIKYPSTWINALQDVQLTPNIPDFVSQIAKPILALEGDSIPVSLLPPNGIMPMGTTAYEKRGVAINIPQWNADVCIECCQCSFVCPHAAIRPTLAVATELVNAPKSFVTTNATGDELFKDMQFRIQVYPEDCLGCGSCVEVCPAGALTLQPFSERKEIEKTNLQFAQSSICLKDNLIPRDTIKGSQLQQPLFEFSGACAGCGETPYIKLLTQLFGERMIIANATGCSSIYGASMPSMPYTVNKNSCGPAWGNSLFEDAAEYGYGIAMSIKQRRELLVQNVEKLINDASTSQELKDKLTQWQTSVNEDTLSMQYGKELLVALNATKQQSSLHTDIISNGDMLGKKTVWVVGGDGWAYDIGFGGLDHVLASGENVNMLVLDTECYSNTGGQTSKATPIGAIAKFSSAGKRTNRKELGRMMMTYGNVYVASIALGADKQQAINALLEAEAYNGPSIVIAYCPCINHGLRKGMGTSITEEARAVNCGYWPLYRYNPQSQNVGQSPLKIDYKHPDGTMPNFLDGEDRYAYLKEIMPDEANVLRTELEKECDRDYQLLSKPDYS